MADDTFRQERASDELPESVKKRVEARESPENAQIKMSGKIPAKMKQALNMVRGQRKRDTGPSQIRAQGSAQLEDLIAGLKPKYVYDEVVLPSKGNFYDGKDGPTDGVLHIRPMTGEEEGILATPRYVRQGTAINMIFHRCLQEQSFRPEDLLSTDRTFLLICLRGISYTPKYDVEVKCPDCERKFQTKIDLNSLIVNDCPLDFRPPLSDTMPISGYKFNYRLSRGKDEQALQEYRDRQLKLWGDTGADDTLIYRTALLLDDIEGLREKHELQMLIKKLPIQDVAFLRNTITDPPFGIDTKCTITCAGCLHDFDVDLPLEAGFFFPRQVVREEEQA